MAFVKEYREVSYMIETAQKKERLLLVAVNTAEESRVRASLEELALLAVRPSALSIRILIIRFQLLMLEKERLRRFASWQHS